MKDGQNLTLLSVAALAAVTTVRRGSLARRSRQTIPQIPPVIEKRILWYEQALQSDQGTYQQDVDHPEIYPYELAEFVLRELLGQDVGLNADWSVSAWNITNGEANRKNGDFYVLQDDDESLSIVQRFYEEEADGDEIVTIHEFEYNLRALIEHLIAHKSWYETNVGRVPRRSLRGLRNKPPEKGSASRSLG